MTARDSARAEGVAQQYGAKAVATAGTADGALAESMGFDVIDAGGLKNARYLEPVAGLNIYFGYGAGLGTSIAPTWIRKN